jgi:protein-disulfide isomerase
MESKSPAVLIIVALVALMFGFLIGAQGKDSLMQNFQTTQMESKTMMGQLMAKLDSMSSSGSVSGPELALLQQRIAALEAKLVPIETFINQVKAGAPQGDQPMPNPEDFNKVYDLPIGNSEVIGTKDAPVKITVFTDIQCPFCSRFHEPIKEVLKAYPGKIAYVIKHFPLSFHPQARSAAKAAMAAAEQGKYEEMVDALYANQRELGEEKYKELAGNLGLNVEQFMNDYKNKDAEWEKQIEEDMSLGERSDVRGTPTFYLNGKKTRARDLATWKQEIDKLLQGK